MSSDFLFAEDDEIEEVEEEKAKWRILIVDDEEEVHNITRLVLSDFRFDNRSLELISAHSAAEAKKIMLSEIGDDIAVAFVDVVMETSHAGLEFVQWVRQELDNHKVRLVLRTGQPGEAPEERVIHDYDINDYKNKTELTALRLKTVVYSALRGYRDILTIERHRAGLEKIIAATTEFIECDTLPQFASAILKQIVVVLGIETSDVICCAAAREATSSRATVNVLASNIDSENSSPICNRVDQRLQDALDRRESIHESDYFIGYFTTKRGNENLLYVARDKDLDPLQHHLLDFFAHNIAVAHENLKLREVIRESQKELSYVIGEAVEMRSKETGSHVKRVAHYSYLLAKLYGLSEQQAEMIKLASPLHDVGKVGIPDLILNKPGRHDQREAQIMQTHANIGYDMLKKSDNPILNVGAVIAREHHERWDGTGYPRGLAGEQIDIAGRISAVADVFDALGSRRCYKEPWSLDSIVELFEMERGKHFDPKLVDLLLQNIDQFVAIRKAFPDPENEKPHS
ncbi:DUF3369 domain-containing protein [Aestuariibacter salexigens]|uniref:DUF3369 domain-containing protein n=1 Tax=Aestuariibacter salexigens TaxID=226010 RepID=UPI000420BB8A|nr:DUF3369 domain-containing protein [Aestuariibacter salexigens]